MQVGDKKTEVLHMGQDNGVTKTGTVVYIHPARRFYVVEFDPGGHKVRESYYFPNRRGGNGPKAKN